MRYLKLILIIPFFLACNAYGQLDMFFKKTEKGKGDTTKTKPVMKSYVSDMTKDIDKDREGLLVGINADIKLPSESNEYNEAETLANRANAELLAGNITLADSLVKRSVEIYPTTDVFKYLFNLGKMPNILGANLIMDKLMERLKNLPGSKVYFRGSTTVKYIDGKMASIVVYYPKQRTILKFGEQAYYTNKLLGDRKSIEKSLIWATDVVLEPMEDKKQIDMDESSLQNNLLIRARFEKDYQKAFELAKNRPVTLIYPKFVKEAALDGLYFEMGDYEKYLHGKPDDFTTAVLKGDTEKAAKLYEKLDTTKAYNYYIGLFNIQQKDYHSAVRRLNKAISVRSNTTMGLFMIEEMWDIYKSLGDAYAGLKEYEKARDNYSIALLYYPEYQPAIDAIAKLESEQVQVIAVDKTPPGIILVEPAPARGLKVTTAAARVMVKGTAKDPSGLKEVLINGVAVYSQNAGDFWGDVPMSDGINKITVTATDMAGNKAEKVFEIEKQAAPAIAAVEIVPIAEKEGKNYCLLVAAQNYADSSIPSLENPVADAIRLKMVLKNNYSFAEGNIITLFNPSTNDLKRRLLELTNTIQPEDNLVIFYAGHGIWVEKEKKGYWLMTDAKYKDINTWLPNKDVLDLIAKLPSRHTLLITDACFSGSVFKTRGLKDGAPPSLKEMDNKITRVAITSGNDTEVPDESVFMKYLVKALSENKEQYLTAQKMFINQIIEAVMAESKTEPRYGTLELAGHVGGDFIFSKK